MTNKEILLVSGSKLAQREFCTKESKERNPNSNMAAEMLEMACWSGLLNVVLDEFCVDHQPEENLYLWRTHLTDTFVYLQLGVEPSHINYKHSIDPLLFLGYKSMN